MLEFYSDYVYAGQHTRVRVFMSWISFYTDLTLIHNLQLNMFDIEFAQH
jgi:hypothetical protein